MSLDVYLLSGVAQSRPCTCAKCGNEHVNAEAVELFSANITHNLTRMAKEAGIYKHLWRPEEIGITKAGELIEPLRAGLALMRSDPARFEALNAPNGWGTYADFVPWLAEYLSACEANPGADVRVGR